MTHIDLFSGIGGFALAARWAGFRTRLFCEIDPFCRAVLAKHWPDVPCVEDVRDVTAELVCAHGIGRVDLLTGGFPCQPWSLAGRQGGEADERHLWPEMLRVVAELRPAWVCGENVPGILTRYLDTISRDLEGEGYRVWPVVVPASAVGAPHRRERVWIVAHADGELSHGAGGLGAGRRTQPANGGDVADAHGARLEERRGERGDARAQRQAACGGGALMAVSDASGRGAGLTGVHGRQSDAPGRGALADADLDGRAFERRGGVLDGIGAAFGNDADGRSGATAEGGRLAQPGVGRVPDGLPAGLHGRWPALPGEAQHEWEPPRTARGVEQRAARLKALGNAIMPQVAYPILAAIAAEVQP